MQMQLVHFQYILNIMLFCCVNKWSDSFTDIGCNATFDLTLDGDLGDDVSRACGVPGHTLVLTLQVHGHLLDDQRAGVVLVSDLDIGCGH